MWYHACHDQESETEHLSMLQRPTTQRERLQTLLPASSDRVVHLVRPQETDARINEELQDHYVMYYKDVPANGKLMVFFPGTDPIPRYYQFVMDTGARLLHT